MPCSACIAPTGLGYDADKFTAKFVKALDTVFKMAGDQPAIVPKAKPPREKKALDSVTETPKVLVQQNPDPESGAYFQEVTGLLVSWDLDGKRFSSVSLVLGTALDIGCSQVAGELADTLLSWTCFSRTCWRLRSRRVSGLVFDALLIQKPQAKHTFRIPSSQLQQTMLSLRNNSWSPNITCAL